MEETAKVVAEEKIPVVTTGAGNPARFMPMWLEAGIKVIPVTPSTTLAKIAQKNGAFAVIAEGGESGGHVGDITTMALVPQICDAVTIPVIAAGGIADGRGIAASFILKAKDIDTIVTGKRLGHPVRSIKNALTREYIKREFDKSQYSDDDLEKMTVGALRRAVKEGDVSKGCVLAGQIAGMVNKEQTAQEMIEEMFTQAEEVLGGASKWVK